MMAELLLNHNAPKRFVAKVQDLEPLVILLQAFNVKDTRKDVKDDQEGWPLILQFHRHGWNFTMMVPQIWEIHCVISKDYFDDYDCSASEDAPIKCVAYLKTLLNTLLLTKSVNESTAGIRKACKIQYYDEADIDITADAEKIGSDEYQCSVTSTIHTIHDERQFDFGMNFNESSPNLCAVSIDSRKLITALSEIVTKKQFQVTFLFSPDPPKFRISTQIEVNHSAQLDANGHTRKYVLDQPSLRYPCPKTRPSRWMIKTSSNLRKAFFFDIEVPFYGSHLVEYLCAPKIPEDDSDEEITAGDDDDEEEGEEDDNSRRNSMETDEG
ncbi:hypothetical protein G9A89_006018 [Geosiphon pyriformis]|nr:hypothetical protein G9A89_006018 [Geosiphon pyriformis]